MALAFLAAATVLSAIPSKLLDGDPEPDLEGEAVALAE
jgi:hypothetical protein